MSVMARVAAVTRTPLRLEAWAAGAAAFLIGFRVFPVSGLTPAFAIGLFLAPVWVPVLRRYTYGTALFLAAAAALASGWALTWMIPPDFHVIGSRFRFDSALFIGLFVGVGALLWARTVLDVRALGLLYGLGALGAAILGGGIRSENPWKYALDVPVSIFALAIAGARRRYAMIALAALTMFSLVFVSRSSLTVFAAAACLVAYQSLRSGWRRRFGWVQTVGLLVAAGVVAFQLFSSAMLSGLLGSGIQERTATQVGAAGTVLTGGRQEMFATLALMAYRFGGFGFGVSVNAQVVDIAKAGMATNVVPDANYVDRYLFGSGVELHSVAGDLWARTGALGLVLAALILLIVARGLAERLRAGTLTALTAALGIWTVWNVFFAPLYSAGSSLSLALALLVQPKPARHVPDLPFAHALPYEHDLEPK